ncbi:MAG: NAD-dependent epimerase/dehydratase family protein [bacterium]|nr:NAD-dependent epimerase/dehydratase family protein [bacterium]
MRIMVTGAGGFIGSTLVDALLERGDTVVGVEGFIDNYDAYLKRSNLADALPNDDFLFAAKDLGDDECYEYLAEEGYLDGVEAVVHLAARPGVRDSWGDHFAEYADNNVLATQKLLEQFKERPEVLFVYASSSSIYGDAASLPVNEDDRPAPVSPYGATKLAGEDLMAVYAKNYGLSPTILRFFTVYGPRQRPDMAIHKFIKRIDAGEPIPVFGDGETGRDYTYIEHITGAIQAIIEKDVRGDVFNVGGGRTTLLKDMIAAVEKSVGKNAEIERLPMQRGDVKDTLADISKLKQAVGYAPDTELEDGIREQVEWMRRAELV